MLFISDPPAVGLAKEYVYKREDVYLQKVIDGDTILLKDGRYIRLIGIDTPEIRKKINGKWVEVYEPYGRQAFEFTNRLLLGKKINIEYDNEIRDSYNRDLCYVFANGILVNEAVMREGLAFPYLKNKSLRYYERLKNAFIQSVKERKNLYKINLKYEKDLKKYINQDVFYEGIVNNILNGSNESEIIFDKVVVIAKDFKKKLKRGQLLYVYGKLIYKKERFLIISDRNKIFYFD
ncbi:MAG: thermonuclease family protein [Proteobacteria bacterium]|nr:thermonuclease family protein [Pseudomonadota bacterium]